MNLENCFMLCLHSKQERGYDNMERVNAEFYLESTLHRDNGVCFGKLKHTKRRLLRSCHFECNKNVILPQFNSAGRITNHIAEIAIQSNIHSFV